MTCTPGLKITPAKIASGVIVHELSHALAGTVDIKFGEGVSVYGWKTVKSSPKKILNLQSRMLITVNIG